ncbi:hypothetical protein [Paracoccus sp. MKU1]|uniref:hypothetical protein n=1 Tax=Paracoccus sp. MKU1 TaxID=1745182 RepID=UPI00071938CD|nr:hypothetical protein [Paracoccus sp. MKU1]
MAPKTYTKDELRRMGVDTSITALDGLTLGQRVRPFGTLGMGTIIGFARMQDFSDSVFIALDSGRGNRRTYHVCGPIWAEAVEEAA